MRHVPGWRPRRARAGGCLVRRDARKPLADLTEHEGLFDRVLVDAPCSGLGALRRNPDARWRLRPEDLEELAQVQRALLESAAQVLRPGGSLVYSTCTVTPEENEGVIRGFMATRANWRIAARAEAPEALRDLIDEEGFLRVLPHWPGRSDCQDMDGFFAVRHVRNPSSPSEEDPA